MAMTPEEIAIEKINIRAGLQCPECYGVHITREWQRNIGYTGKFQCEECGCQWDKNRL